MEEKDMARIELNEQNLEDVVGGAFNWYTSREGEARCRVDGIGDYKVTSTAMTTYTKLKLQHKLDGWTAQDYVNAMLSAGAFQS